MSGLEITTGCPSGAPAAGEWAIAAEDPETTPQKPFRGAEPEQAHPVSTAAWTRGEGCCATRVGRETEI